MISTITTPITNLWHRLFYQRPFIPPKKAIILQPGTVSDVMLATPMLAILKRHYPEARFDWGVCETSIPIVAGNVHVTKLLIAARTPFLAPSEHKRLLQRLKDGAYDSCFIPDKNPQLAAIARRAGIPQRIGLWHRGLGRSYTHPVRVPVAERHRGRINVAIGNIENDKIQFDRIPMAFYPSDTDRKVISERLIEELDWLGDRTLVVINPGVGYEGQERQWPLERFVLLCNRIIKNHQAKLLLVGEEMDRKAASEVAGMIAGSVVNWTGRIGFGELGALTELADLYIGNDCGSTHISAAMGCKTLAIFGPTDPGVSAPYHIKSGRVSVLWKDVETRPFSWQDGVTVREAERAVRKILEG